MTAVDPVWAVTGASGRLAGLAVDHLRAIAPANVTLRAVTRNVGAAREHWAGTNRVEVVEGDFNDVALTASALRGADRVLLVSTHDWMGGERWPVHRKAVEAISRAEVPRVVYTSFQGARVGSDSIIENDHGLTEEALDALGIDWVPVRHHLYYEEVASVLYPHLLRDGHFYIPTGSRPTSLIARADCARVDAAILAADDLPAEPVEPTGPEALTFEQIAARLEQVRGVSPILIPMPWEQLADALEAQGATPADARMAGIFARDIASGRFGEVTAAVRTWTGRDPEPIDGMLKAAAL